MLFLSLFVFKTSIHTQPKLYTKFSYQSSSAILYDLFNIYKAQGKMQFPKFTKTLLLNMVRVSHKQAKIEAPRI